MIINSEKGGRCPFAMKIPMDAFGCFALEIEYKARDFQVSKEIFEDHRLVAMYEESSVHAAKIRIFLMCHSERSEESDANSIQQKRLSNNI